jgi:phage-related protein
MKFEQFKNQKNESYLKKYLSDFDAKTQKKIADKLSNYEKRSFFQLTRDEIIKHIEDKLYEVRVRIKNGQHRLLGTVCEGCFWIVHCFLKKKNKMKKSDKDIGTSRVDKLLNNKKQ